MFLKQQRERELRERELRERELREYSCGQEAVVRGSPANVVVRFMVIAGHVLLVYTPPFIVVVGLDTRHMATILMLMNPDYSHLENSCPPLLITIIHTQTSPYKGFPHNFTCPAANTTTRSSSETQTHLLHKVVFWVYHWPTPTTTF